MRHRFPIGTQYAARRASNNRSHPVICEVVDQLTTTNSRGEVTRVAYVTAHMFCGQLVTESDVVDITIARGLLPEFVHLLEA